MSKNVDSLKQLYPKLDFENSDQPGVSAVRDMAHRLDRFDSLTGFATSEGGKFILSELRNEAMSTLAEAMKLAEMGEEHLATTKLLELKPLTLFLTAFRGADAQAKTLEAAIKQELETIVAGGGDPV